MISFNVKSTTKHLSNVKIVAEIGFILLNNYGFSNVFDNIFAFNVKSFIISFKSRVVVDCVKKERFRMLESLVLSMKSSRGRKIRKLFRYITKKFQLLFL